MGVEIEIPSAILTRLMREFWIDAHADASNEPHITEKCGILRGRGNRVRVADALANVSATPETAFEIDPAALIAAHRQARRANALQLMGYYHTHPSGDPWPSVHDADGAAPDGMLWLIVAPMRVRLWRAVEGGAVHGRFDPMKVSVVTGSRRTKGVLEMRHVD